MRLWYYEALFFSQLKVSGNKYKLTLKKLEMFSLFYGLWKYIFTKTEFHVLILGIDKAGKTVICFADFS